MVNILPKVPGFGERFGAALGGGLSQGMSKGTDFAMKMALEQEKSRNKQKALQKDLSEENRILKEKYGIEVEGITDPTARGAVIKQGLKEKGEEEKAGKHYKTFTKILDSMEEGKKYVGTTKIPGLASFGGETGYGTASERRAKIKTQRLSLEGLFRDLTLKGQFPKALYEIILKELPNTNDTEREYQGHINAVREIVEAHWGPEAFKRKGDSSAKERPPLESFYE